MTTQNCNTMTVMQLPELSESAKATAAALVADVFESFRLIQVNSASQFARRTLVRTLFSFLEGFGRILRQTLLQLPNQLTVECQSILTESKYEIEDTGKPRVVD